MSSNKGFKETVTKEVISHKPPPLPVSNADQPGIEIVGRPAFVPGFATNSALSPISNPISPGAANELGGEKKPLVFKRRGIIHKPSKTQRSPSLESIAKRNLKVSTNTRNLPTEVQRNDLYCSTKGPIVPKMVKQGPTTNRMQRSTSEVFSSIPRFQPKLSELSPSNGKKGKNVKGKPETTETTNIFKFPHKISLNRDSDLPHLNPSSCGKLKPLFEPAKAPSKPGNLISPLIRRPKTRYFRLSDGAILHTPNPNVATATPIRTTEQMKKIRSITPGKYTSVQVPHVETKETPVRDIVQAYAVRSRKGFSPNRPGKVNQDTYFIKRHFANHQNVWMLGVCDGHGVFGHLVSDYIKIRFPAEKEFKKLARRGSVTHAIKNVEETKDALGGLLAESKQVRAQLIKEAVEKTNQELYAQEFDTKFSGSTMVFTLLLGKSIVCGNIGDSRAVIASHKQRGTGKIWIATPLSRDHKPDLPDEERRILNSNGRIEAFKDLFGNSIGPARVWLRNETYPGLAMSRSLGDKAARQCGVTELPEVTEKPLTAEDKVVIIGSDGIWEFITNIQAVEMVVPFWLNKDVEGACDKLVNEATSRWEKADASIDDITCIVIFINPE